MKSKTIILTPTVVLVCSSMCCYFLTAIIGLWVAYDLVTAFQRFAVVIAGLALMFVIAWSGRHHAKTVLGQIGIVCTLVAAGLSIASLLRLTDDSDMVAGTLLALLPLGISSIFWEYSNDRRSIAYGIAIVWAIGLIGLIGSQERTAWLSLTLGIACVAHVHWRFSGLQPGRVQRLAGFAIAFIAGAVLVLYIGLLIIPSLDQLNWLLLATSDQERLHLWRESLALIDDYRFTGSGLGSTTMIFSTYAYLLHVPFYYHAHNIYLQIALEQGLPGLFAFLGICIPVGVSLLKGYTEAGPNSRIFFLATLASIISILVSGALDSALLYSNLMPIMFVPFGCAMALHWAQQHRLIHTKNKSHPTGVRRDMRLVHGAAGLMPLVAVLILLLWPGSLAHMYANLGAVTQTRAELGKYRWPQWVLQDQVRLEDSQEMTTAIHFYETALTYDPNINTAHRRLGQIALSRGEFATAQAHLIHAYETEPQLRATRQLLGEIFAINNDFEQAVTLWRTISLEQGQLDIRQEWYRYNGANQQAERLAQAMAQMKQ